jgi:hypothetical protein
MTSSYPQYKLNSGSDWPEFPVTEKEWNEVPIIYKEEMIASGYAPTHCPSFLNLYCKEKGFKEINLAVGGSSNLKIRQQIDQAIKLKPDYIIIEATDWSRQDFIEISDPNDVTLEMSFAYKFFLTEMYNDDAKKISDYYILQSGLILLEKLNIPYVFIPGPMKKLDWEFCNILWPDDVISPWFRANADPNLCNHVVFNDHVDLCKELIKITKQW